MDRLSDRHSPATHLRALRVLAIRLIANDAAKHMEPDISAARVTVRDALEVFEVAEAARQAATLVVYYRDAALDGRVRKLVLDAHAAFGSREDAGFRSLFRDEAPSDQMRPRGSDEQTRYVLHIRDALAGATAEPLTGLAAKHLTPLVEAQDALDAALAAREAAHVEEAKAQVALQRAVEGARRLYNGAHAQLSVLCPEQSELVESFFLDL